MNCKDLFYFVSLKKCNEREKNGQMQHDVIKLFVLLLCIEDKQYTICRAAKLDAPQRVHYTRRWHIVARAQRLFSINGFFYLLR